MPGGKTADHTAPDLTLVLGLGSAQLFKGVYSLLLGLYEDAVSLAQLLPADADPPELNTLTDDQFGPLEFDIVLQTELKELL